MKEELLQIRVGWDYEKLANSMACFIHNKKKDHYLPPHQKNNFLSSSCC